MIIGLGEPMLAMINFFSDEILMYISFVTSLSNSHFD